VLSPDMAVSNLRAASCGSAKPLGKGLDDQVEHAPVVPVSECGARQCSLDRLWQPDMAKHEMNVCLRPSNAG
jgi:hypothetical protein